MFDIKAGGIYRCLVGVMLFFAGFFVFAMKPAEATTFAERAASMAEIMDVRVSSDRDHTRIVVDSTKELEYETSIISNPQRVVIDVPNAWIKPGLKKNISVDSRFVKSVRVAQHDQNTVRIVVESTLGKNNRKFFTLKGGASGHRLVLDFGNFQKSSDGAAIDFGKKEGTSEKPQTTDEVSKPTDSTEKPETVSSKPTEEPEVIIPVVEPEFTPGLQDKKIVIDAGHGGCDVGAIGPTGVTEKSITLRIAQEVQRLLTEAGAQPIMTRNRDTEVSPKKVKATDVEELQARCDVANKANADIFVSIHMDSFTNSTPSGTTGYYYGKGTKAAMKLARDVSGAVTSALSTSDRGVKSCNFYVVKHTTMPAILLEVAFISNEREEKMMNSEAGIKKAAAGIVKGIRQFFDTY